MTDRAPRPRIAYCAYPLDRASHLRRDAARLAAAESASSTRVVPVWRGRNLIGGGDSPALAALAGEPARRVLAATRARVFLGADDEGAWFAADLSEIAEADLAGILAGAPEGAAFQELRAAGALMAGGDAALLACARGLVHWHGTSRFCGACGAPTESRDGGHARRCTDAACGRDHFPRTDPAVIMLLTRPAPPRKPDEGRCLLARQPHWPEGMYSALAGFVEPGEGLEAAVAREAMEEVGLGLAALSYRASQPWPFPASLMLGFRAEAAGDVIRRDEKEIADARWFTRAELKTLPQGDLKLSRPDSIARFLIEEWLAEKD
jgi:NAD+ diphosphatase